MKRIVLMLLLLVWGFNSVYAQDKDSLIDIFDLVMVAGEFGQNDVGLSGDVNGDNSVNIFDLVMVAGQFGQSGAGLSGDVSKPQEIIETNSMVTIDTPVGDPAVGNDLHISIKINQGSNIAGYQFTLEFDNTALEYVTIVNADFLPAGAFVIPPKVSGSKITLAATSLAGGTNGDGTLAKATLKVLKKSDSTLKLSGVKLADPSSRSIALRTVDGKVTAGLDMQDGLVSTDGLSAVFVDPAVVESPTVGENLDVGVKVNQDSNVSNVAGYQFTLEFDNTALEYVTIVNADFLPAGAFAIPPEVNDDRVTFAATSLAGGVHGDGTLAKATFRVLRRLGSALKLSGVTLYDSGATAIASRTVDGKVVSSELAEGSSSFSVRGNVTEADGTAVGEGYMVKAVNQRVSGWSIYTDGKTRADGSYTDINFIDFLGKTTNAGDQIVLTVVEEATGQTKGEKIYTITQQMVTDMSARVDIRLSGIMAEFSPSAEVLADGVSSLQITVTVQDETGALVKDDSLTLGSAKGSVIGEVVNNGDGTYSTTYSPLSLVISGSVSDFLQVTSSKLNQSVLETVTLLEVPTIVTMLAIPQGISLIHLPLVVTSVNDVATTVTTVSSFYDAIGADNVNLLITYDNQAKVFRSYLGDRSKGQTVDLEITADLGIIALMKKATTLKLKGDALGTDGKSQISLGVGLNLVGVPLKDSRISKVSDLLALEGLSALNAVVSDNGVFKVISQAGDDGDIDITGGQSFVMTSVAAATAEVSGEAWDNVSTATSNTLPMTANGRILVVVGKVYDGYDQLVKSELTGTAKIGDVSVPVSFEADGTYSATFFSFTDSIASNGDIVELTFVNQNGDIFSRLVELTTEQVANQLADEIDVNPDIAQIIPDANLRSALEQALGKNAGDAITKEDLAGLTELTHEGKEGVRLTDLTGLEHCVNLTSLSLMFNRITDISVFKYLTSLTHLDINGNPISDNSPISQLTNLKTLWAPYTGTVDLTPLKDLKDLEDIHLYGNLIQDITPLLNLTKLKYLRLDNNKINDITPLLNSNSLSELDLRGNPLSNTAYTTHIPALKARGITVEYDEPPADIVTFKDANLEKAIRDALGIRAELLKKEDLAELKELKAHGANIRDLKGLEHCTNLTSLNFGQWLGKYDGNQIVDLTPISKLTNLTKLWLSDNEIDDISALAGLTNLVHLELDANSISDISVLANLTRLIRLWLPSNEKISDISVLANLTELHELHLGGNEINGISGLANLTNLWFLHLWENQITDIGALSNLTNLTSLVLNNNKVSDITPLVGNTGISGEIYLKSNPLNSTALFTHIPTLIRRGINRPTADQTPTSAVYSYLQTWQYSPARV